MGAALHLAHAHQPEPTGHERHGGGGGGGYIDTVRRIYQDPRAGHEAKELLLAVAYAVGIAPPREDGRGPLNTAAQVLGRDKAGHPRFDTLVAADAPRYAPPRSALNWGPSQAPECEAPRLRPYKPRTYRPRSTPGAHLAEPLRPPTEPIVHVPPGYKPPRDWRTEDGVCGAQSHHRVIERDPLTGWAIPHWFCKRHHAHAERVTEQVQAQNEAAPEPIPNQGGLLPCYFEADWRAVYERYTGPRWQPPSYGIRADDWPIPGKEPAIHHPRLRLIVGGTDLDAPDNSP